MAAGAAQLAEALSLQDKPEAYRYILAQPQIAGSQMVRLFTSLLRFLPLTSRAPPFVRLTSLLFLFMLLQVTEIMQLPSEQRDVLVVRLFLSLSTS